MFRGTLSTRSMPNITTMVRVNVTISMHVAETSIIIAKMNTMDVDWQGYYYHNGYQTVMNDYTYYTC